MFMSKVSELPVNALIDLENDPYADPDGDVMAYAYAFVVITETHSDVVEGQRRTTLTVHVGDDGERVIAFPSDHEVEVEIAG